MTERSQLERGGHSSPIPVHDQGAGTPFVSALTWKSGYKRPPRWGRLGLNPPGGQGQAGPATEKRQATEGRDDAEPADAGHAQEVEAAGKQQDAQGEQAAR